jgi:hypothetical protein
VKVGLRGVRSRGQYPKGTTYLSQDEAGQFESARNQRFSRFLKIFSLTKKNPEVSYFLNRAGVLLIYMLK